MRSYMVQPGDSPSRIAIEFAGCPKCVAELVDANPDKPTVTASNGYRTFAELTIGEELVLPETWFDGEHDARPESYFDALPPAPQGLSAPPQGLGLVVPVASIDQTANFVTGPISVPPCHQALLTVFPIPQGIVGSDPAAVLKDLGFDAQIGSSPTGGSYVIAVNTSKTAYTSSDADALGTLVYSGEGYPWAGSTVNAWQVGETVTGESSGVTATVVEVHDDTPADGNGYLVLSGASSRFTWGETIKGASSGNTATALAFGAVMSSASGMLGVTNFVDAGPSASCGCPAGQVQDTVTGQCVSPCPGGFAPAAGVCPVIPIVPGGGGGGGGGAPPGGGTHPPAAGTFQYQKGHRIQSVGMPATGVALPPSIANQTVASMQASFDKGAPGQWSVVSVVFGPSIPQVKPSVTVVADYCGPLQSLVEPTSMTTAEGVTMLFSHTDLGPSPAGVTCGAGGGGGGGGGPVTVTPPKSSSAASGIAIAAIGAAIIGAVVYLK